MINPGLLQLAVFIAVWFVGMYAVACLQAGNFRKIDIKQAFLHIAVLAVLGMIAEICIGNSYDLLFGKPLWHYQVLPIHGAYTSLFAPFIWGAYGFYIYLFHPYLLKSSSFYGRHLVILFCLETIAVEGIGNLLFRLYTGGYIYYYFPPDLLHYSSFQTIPFSFIGKYVIGFMLQNGKPRPIFFAISSLAVILILVTV